MLHEKDATTTCHNNGWDGTNKSRPVKADVYVWKVEAKDVMGNKHELVGHVSQLIGT